MAALSILDIVRINADSDARGALDTPVILSLNERHLTMTE
jgi:hypothetical protein